MVGFQGREHQWDIELDGVPFRCVRDENGVPDWSSQSTPEVANRAVQIADEADEYRTWHLGFGYSHKLIEGAYHWASGVDCLPGDTTVSSPSTVKGAVRRWYDGEVVQITTASGHQLTATPNHPVLTNRGWIGLGLLKEGDYVFHYKRLEPVAHGAHDVQNANPTIEQVFGLATNLGACKRIAGGAEQFHGDGQQGNVHVVTANRHLRRHLQALFRQPLHQKPLSSAHLLKIALSSLSLGQRPRLGMPITPQGIDSRLGELPSSFRRTLADSQFPSIDRIPEHACVGQDAMNNLLPNMKHGLKTGRTRPVDVLPRNSRPIYSLYGTAPSTRYASPFLGTELSQHCVTCLAGGSEQYARTSQTTDHTGYRCAQLFCDSTRRLPDLVKTDHNGGVQELMGSYCHTGINQTLPDTSVVNPQPPGDVLPTPTSKVLSDHVVSIKRRHFAGHVYNLHTQSGWYIANGIIAHNCRFPRQITMGPLVTILGLTGAGVYDSSNYDSSAIYGGSADGNVVGFFEQSSTLYILASRYAQRIDLGSDSYWTANGAVDGKDFGATKACTSAVNFDASTVVGMGNTEGVWTFDGTTWDQATDQTPDIAAGYLAKAYLETFFALARTFTSSSEPVIDWISEGSTIDSTSWGADYNIGDRAAAVTGLASFAEKWFVAKTDGLYATDRTGRMPCVVPLRSIVSTNGQNVTVDSMGYVWFPTIEGYYRYDSSNGEVIDCSPGRALPNASPIYGRITAHVQYKGWWYCSVYNGTDSYIMVGRERENGEPGVGPMVWHGALCKVANEAINCMHVTGLVTPPRLYFGAGSAVGYIRLPLTADNPLLDSYYRYASSGSIYLSASNWGVPGTGWYLSAIEMECKNLTTTTYINVYAKLNNGNWQHIQKVDVAGSVTVTMPEGSSWLFGECSLRLDFTNSDSALTPIVTSIVARATRRVAVSDLISTTLLCSNRVLSRYDIQTRLSGKEQLKHLKDLSMTSPVIVSDWWTGSKRDLTVLVMPVTERIVREPREDAVDMAASVTLRVLSEPDAASYIQAQNVGIYDQSTYDGNDTYGGVRVRVFTQ